MAMGRPREFNPEDVLDKAMTLFWEHGYDGVSISDLTSATGVNRRSLYAEFGSKEQLFYKAVDRYLAGPGGFDRLGHRLRDGPWRCGCLHRSCQSPGVPPGAGSTRRGRGGGSDSSRSR
ncbi:TetR/AcrR family transcriptional regulator [Mycolicibacterium sp. NCC-Tsukiji]|uniref:TetR/AcrR family transcriptional regulator n=1 Tax=Mycolicibacterium sp. NCC-Tsukiji TaxID=2185272 RepID=UPI000EDE7242|nr:TetR/AcrR family transcriptional regulator [Mycolicibacterium sp. NCC-Tsukiji]GCA97312.1 hypothetical protein NCCNTM_09470 [Mycolicibacterium sp. NCC-Tsukiji]